MEKPERSCVILSGLNLDDAEEVVREAYHRDGSPGRPPRKPMGVFKTLIVKRLQQVPSDRELYRRLWNDADMRELCDLEAEQKPYHPSQSTRFRNRIEAEESDRCPRSKAGDSLSRKSAPKREGLAESGQALQNARSRR